MILCGPQHGNLARHNCVISYPPHHLPPLYFGRTGLWTSRDPMFRNTLWSKYVLCVCAALCDHGPRDEIKYSHRLMSTCACTGAAETNSKKRRAWIPITSATKDVQSAAIARSVPTGMREVQRASLAGRSGFVELLSMIKIPYSLYRHWDVFVAHFPGARNSAAWRTTRRTSIFSNITFILSIVFWYYELLIESRICCYLQLIWILSYL